VNILSQTLRHGAGLVLLSLALAGCSGGAASLAPGAPAKDDAGGAKPLMPVTAGLPSLSDLATRAASFTELGLMAEGSQYQVMLSVNRATVNGTDLQFAPAVSGTSSARTAYAIYAFDAAGYNRDMNVRLTWTTAPAVGTAYLALANFAAGHWDWFAVPADNIVPFTKPLASYVSPGPGNPMYAAVLVTSGTATLDRLRVGTQPSTGLPTAVLDSDRFTVPPGGTVWFDCRGSSANAPATIVSYDFDPGDGPGFQPNDLDQFGYQYNTLGTYSAQLRVADTFGATDTVSLTITVAGVANYDEIEDNDSVNEANLLKLPCRSWRGNVGLNSPFGDPLYDADNLDVFRIETQAGEEIGARLSFFGGAVDADLYLIDSAGNTLAASTSYSNEEQLRYTTTDADAGACFLVVYAAGGGGDYILHAQVDGPRASLSATPPGGLAPLQVTLDASLSSDPNGTVTGYAFDPLGDGNFSDVQASPLFNYTYPASQVYNPMVAVYDGDEQFDFTSTVVYPGSPYDEQEPNSVIALANTLPAMPFNVFSGNIGYTGPYNQDAADWFKVDADPGDTVRFTLTVPTSTGEIALYLTDGATEYASSQLTSDTQTVEYTVQPGDPQLYLLVLAGMTSFDYNLQEVLNPPQAALISTNGYSGTNPLLTTLDASASTAFPPSTIATYAFDVDGDGVFSPPQPTPTVAANYNADGLFRSAVRVTDTLGRTDDATIVVFIGKAYAEVEENDVEGSANLLPAFPFANWEGSLGPGSNYDGDGTDYITWAAQPAGTTVNFTLLYSNATGELSMDIFDFSSGTWEDVAFIDGVAGSAVLSYQLGSGDGGGPYVLRIWDPVSTGFNGDYVLGASTS
jgi:hypothetical protein